MIWLALGAVLVVGAIYTIVAVEERLEDWIDADDLAEKRRLVGRESIEEQAVRRARQEIEGP